jgi:uncharacterized membrane protein YphA (DoxX/SURF4 family)
MDKLKRYWDALPALFIGVVFVQSLYFKFMRSPETVYIFEEKLDPWAASLGFPGLFAPTGIFSAYAVGSAELLASVLLLISTVARWPRVQGLAALLSLGVISGAIFFHLFTPLGVSVRNADGSYDGGQLFLLACGVWMASALLIVARRKALLSIVGRR